MIQQLANRYRRAIAYSLLSIFYLSVVAPLYAAGRYAADMPRYYIPHADARGIRPAPAMGAGYPGRRPTAPVATRVAAPQKKDIGGPSQPEMSSFKSIGTDNMVNLFTGDFSYNIPLLDVGGYPVNLFYDGGVGIDQEASWVGLGWNINPGNINRNVRGVPDDFDGTDTLTQTQTMKPNVTWGVSVGGDFEGIGIKDLPGVTGSLGASLGVSFNNYLGPAIDLGVKGGVQFKVAGKAAAEKEGDTTIGTKIGLSLGANAGSRTGVTLSPGISLTSKSFLTGNAATIGLSAATSYNSRTGIKDLQISGQTTFNSHAVLNNVISNLSRFSTTISFARPSYFPSIRMPLTNEAWAGHFQVGGALWGAYASAEMEVYKQTSSVADENVVQHKPMVGYLYYQNAQNNPAAVMDFTRFNDKEVMPATPVISVPQYSYDVFAIQGEGTGGSIRAYRNDLGYVRDNSTTSKDRSRSIGVDIGIPGHFGANFNTIKTPSAIGEWITGNKLRNILPFGNASGLSENVYFRNPGESSVLQAGQFDRIGGTDLVRFRLGGSGYNPTIEPQLERFSSTMQSLGTLNITTATNPGARKKRSQVVNFLTADEAARAGLDKMIKSYDAYTLLDGDHRLQYRPIPRDSGYRKGHHISEIDVTEANGKRYIYGIPVYNIVQKDFTFSVPAADPNADQVAVDNANELDSSSGNLHSDHIDGYLQVTETPAYAHSFLLSGLLSPDYVDLTGDGITDDDPGEAVKFNYTRVRTNSNSDWAVHKWRTPMTSGNAANFNAGSRSETKDDKGIISYGERESWYTHSIESKTMIAVFTLENRNDGKNTLYTYGGVDGNDSSLKRLKRIDLYSKADLQKNGLTGAKPVKSVFFGYSYSLCSGTPDNYSGGGKLTLDSIWFTFNGQVKNNKNKYVFSYKGSDTSAAANNLGYEVNGSDRWGNYKPHRLNPQGMRNGDYPYSLQDKALKDSIDRNAGMWSLKKILLPSGGQIEVEYESDDYAFVQNRRAADMMQVAGFGTDTVKITPYLYGVNGYSIDDAIYLFVNVPDSCASKTDVYYKYLQGVDQLSVRYMVTMPKGPEYLTSYAGYSDYGVTPVNNHKVIWIKMQTVDGLSPLSLTALEYLREQLPGQAFPGYDVSESSGLQQVGEMLIGLGDGIKNMFTNPLTTFRSDGKARKVTVNQSFVRLNDPDGYKYGGGQRVKSVKMKDNWAAMTHQFTSVYGQTYCYTTTEVFNGMQRTISSGVASYEPSIGGEENPFQSIVQVSNRLPLGPASYGSVEMPVMDAFFPAPSVGYSKVTVRSINNLVTDTIKKSRSGIGKQVTEFYTAKDFPVYYSNTPIDPKSDIQSHQSSTNLFFYKYAYDYRTLSQGFLVATNDMHGKMKSQSSYAQNDENTRINYTENFYRNTGGKGLNEKFNFIYADQGGKIDSGNIGIDVDLMTDTREFTVKSSSLEVQGQVDLFPVFLPIWLPFIWPVVGNSENIYRAVTTTKVISYHSVLDSVVVIDKGSQVSTKNLVYDAETGDVIVNRTNNEFNKPVYTTKYPAYWAYSGMGPAYKNIDAVYTASFYDGRINSGSFDQSIFESGDELYIYPGQNWRTPGCVPFTGDAVRVWAYDLNKNSTALTSPTRDLVFMDRKGKLFTDSTVRFRIIRSGKRNMLDATVASVVTMNTPMVTVSGVLKLSIDSSMVVNATANEFREKWQVDNDVIYRYSLSTDPSTCVVSEVPDCDGYLEKNVNPYVKGLVGNFRPYRSMVFYDTRMETDASTPTILSRNGFLKSFKPYWNFNSYSNLAPDVSNPQWVWNNQLTKVNAKGQELETKNALNIYTAAQYGYEKSMPLAITNNARFTEAAYDGFEDDGFDENILTAAPAACAGNKHIDFATIPHVKVIFTDTINYAAHTGKRVLGINAGDSAMKSFPIKTVIDSFQLLINRKDTANVLTDLGVVMADVYKYPYHLAINNSSIEYGATMFAAPSGDTVVNGPDGLYREYDYVFSATHYIEILQSGTYTLKGSYTGGTTTLINPYHDNTYKGFSSLLYGMDDVQLFPVFSTGNDTSYTYTYCLQAGVYRITSTAQAGGASTPSEDYPSPGGIPGNTFRVSVKGTDNVALPLYQTVSRVNGCINTVPMAASDSMFNSTFSLTAGKRMVFSAWVRESTQDTSYKHNHVTIKFDNGGANDSTLTPSGPVVDGWQRYEAYFTVPSGATSMTLDMANTSGGTVFFDDIRLHPYNANMKSYVYDPVNLRLIAELDPNNYATFYEYDEEGTLIRTKAETRNGIKTITETRSAKQKKITNVQ